ncbi:P-loop containing nucleoside triphosphate hydrolase protein [Trichoderma evansii]
MGVIICMRSKMLIIVLPTGGGKSIFFYLPSLINSEKELGGKTNVIIILFITLANDLVARACDFGIDCMQWRSDVEEAREEWQRDASLVVVSADIAVYNGFTLYLDSIWGRGLLGIIFFNKCHIIIMDVSYWERLGSLVSLHRYGCLMGVTARINIWYRVRRVKAESRSSVEDGAWCNGKRGQRWIAAITGLGTGVDIKEVVAIIHMRQPYGIVDFRQQTGRGGQAAVWYNKFGSDVDYKNRKAIEMQGKEARVDEGEGESEESTGSEIGDGSEGEGEGKVKGNLATGGLR